MACGAAINLSDDHEAARNRVVELGVFEILSDMFVEALSFDSLSSRAAFHAIKAMLGSADVNKRIGERLGLKLLEFLRYLSANALEEEFTDVSEVVRDLVNDSNALAPFTSAECVALLLDASLIDQKGRGVFALILAVCVSSPKAALFVREPVRRAIFEKSIVSWMHEQDPEMRIAGALAVGNLACSDETAVQALALAGAKEALKQMMTDADSKCMHAAFGAVKNLSVAVPNKKILLDYGFADQLLGGTQSVHGPIQYQAASIARSLCLHQAPEDVRRLAESPGLIPSLAKLSTHDDLPVRAESIRALGNFVRHANSADLASLLASQGAVETFTSLLSMLEQPSLVLDGLLSLLYMTSFGIQNVESHGGKILPLLTSILGSDLQVGPALCPVLIV